MGYRFSVEKFKENFNAKDITDKSIDSVRITHRPDGVLIILVLFMQT